MIINSNLVVVLRVKNKKISESCLYLKVLKSNFKILTDVLSSQALGIHVLPAVFPRRRTKKFRKVLLD